VPASLRGVALGDIDGGQWRELVEFPLAPPARSGPAWAASIWPDAAAGWTRQLWLPRGTGRGWWLPARLGQGTIVEFGADYRHRRRTTAHRWYGIAISHDGHFLVLDAPYTHPAEAQRAADALLESARQQANAIRATPDGERRRPRLS
jgi:hypothetical protein